MKFLKVLAVAIIAMFAFEGAQAQVVVRARVGAPVRTYHRTTVVTTRPVYRPRYRRTVVVNRPVYRRRTVVVNRPVYRRSYHRRVVVRHY